jgi:hypothetical protein
MKFSLEKASVKQIQWMVWPVVWVILFTSYLPEDGVGQAAVYSCLNGVFYATVVYVNILLLFPRLYQKGKRYAYFGAVLVFLILIGTGRAAFSWLVYNAWFAKGPEKYDPLPLHVIATSFLSGVFIFILSLIFRIAIAYFSLKKQTEEILLQKSHAELNLLKSQVQPHFLFNTLNNIYYESYREAPRTALLIERLSGIMRYFVDESPKQYVLLATEIQFLENYMALEQIRIRYGVHIHFIKEGNPDWRVPPMLLMTFVENIFKHGIDKTSPLNRVDILLRGEDAYLYFETRNPLRAPDNVKESKGFGIKNLRERLTLLYGNNFELRAEARGQEFVSYLKFPLT